MSRDRVVRVIQNHITGCAVEQHCYNGDVSFLWENGKFDPYKIEILEQIDIQFVVID